MKNSNFARKILSLAMAMSLVTCLFLGAIPAFAEETDIVTTNFVYVGSNENITADNLVAYITWGTAKYNANAEDCGFTVTREDNTLTLQIDKGLLTDAVWMKIWDNVEWTTWDSINPSFDGETYYLYDGGVFSTSSPSEEQPEVQEYHFTVHCYGEGYQIGAWMALVEGGAEVDWTASSDSIAKEFTDLVDGWTTAELSWSQTKTFNRLSFQFGYGNPWVAPTLNYDFTERSGEIWIVPGDTTVYTSKEAALEATGGEIPDPPEAPETQEYTFTVHCYGEGYQIGAWMALVENDTEVAWTASSEAFTAEFADLVDGWTTVNVTWNVASGYNRLSFQIGEGTPWGSSTYNYDFTNSAGEIWIVPGDYGVYLSQEDANEATIPGEELIIPPATDPSTPEESESTEPTEPSATKPSQGTQTPDEGNGAVWIIVGVVVVLVVVGVCFVLIRRKK